MHLINPAGLGLLALAVPVVLLHVLRPHRTARPVSSTLLWRELASPVSAATARATTARRAPRRPRWPATPCS